MPLVLNDYIEFLNISSHTFVPSIDRMDLICCICLTTVNHLDMVLMDNKSAAIALVQALAKKPCVRPEPPEICDGWSNYE